MEFVVAWQDTEILAFLEILRADGAAKSVVVGSTVLGGGGGCCCDTLFMFFWRCHCLCLCRHRIIRGIVGLIRCTIDLRAWSGGAVDTPALGRGRQLYVSWLRGLFLAKLDNGNGFQDCSSKTSCSALTRPAQDVARTIAFGMAMCSDSSCDDDDQKQGGDDPSDAVQDDHCNSRGWRRTQGVLLRKAAIVAVAVASPLHLDGKCRRLAHVIEERRGGLLVSHGEYGKILQHLLVVVGVIGAVVGHGAVQDDTRDIGSLVRIFEQTLGVHITGIVGSVAVYVGNLAVGYGCVRGRVGVIEAALDGLLCRLARERYEVCNASLIPVGVVQGQRARKLRIRRRVGRADGGRRRRGEQEQEPRRLPWQTLHARQHHLASRFGAW